MNSLNQLIEVGDAVVVKQGIGYDVAGEVAPRVFIARGGFGCSPDTMGTCIAATRVASGINGRIEGIELLRRATPEDLRVAEDAYQNAQAEEEASRKAEPQPEAAVPVSAIESAIRDIERLRDKAVREIEEEAAGAYDEVLDLLRPLTFKNGA